MSDLRKVRKALVSAAGAAVSGLGAFMLDGSLTWAEATMAAGAGLVFGFAAWRVPNDPA